MKIGVIGTGHVGLVTCASLAHAGHEVTGCDVDEVRIGTLQKGQAPFFEPGLDDLLAEQIEAGRLAFTLDSEEAVAGADVVFICVGTPPRESGDADLSAVEQSVIDVARKARAGAVVVQKSTVPAGTATRLRDAVERVRPGREIEIASNPEFLREGRAIHDFLHPDRIVVGAESERASEVMRAVYRSWIERGCRFIETDTATAELAKHACNAFLALKISYANALARLCERAGADVTGVAEVMGSDDRIGRAFLDAGLGYGGHCIPKDLRALERLADALGYDFPILREVERVNEEALDAAVDKIVDAVGDLEGKRVALLGLAFKPGTDDVRSAPALRLARRLLDRGARVAGYDPVASEEARRALPEIEIATDPYGAAGGAQCVVLCTEWDELAALDLGELKSALARPVFVDGRNMFDPGEMARLGFVYYATARPSGSRVSPARPRARS